MKLWKTIRNGARIYTPVGYPPRSIRTCRLNSILVYGLVLDAIVYITQLTQRGASEAVDLLFSRTNRKLMNNLKHEKFNLGKNNTILIHW